MMDGMNGCMLDDISAIELLLRRTLVRLVCYKAIVVEFIERAFSQNRICILNVLFCTFKINQTA